MSEAIKSAMKRLGVSGVNKPKRTPGSQEVPCSFSESKWKDKDC